MNDDMADAMAGRQSAAPAHGSNGFHAGNGVQAASGRAFAWSPPAPPAPSYLSPSFVDGREQPAYEVKFVLDARQASGILAWARECLELDPHAARCPGHAYAVHGLYFDTPNLDVFQRSSGYRRKKYRLRRYGDEEAVFLEQKRKKGDRVAKRRTLVSPEDLARLTLRGLPSEAPAYWFQRRLAVRALAPACQISYQRTAFLKQTDDGPLRLTLDGRIVSRMMSAWEVGAVADGRELLEDRTLLELKFRTAMPALFKTLVTQFGLSPGPCSKYRLAVASWGGTALGKEVG